MNVKNKTSVLDDLMGQISTEEFEETAHLMKLAARIWELVEDRNLNKRGFAALMGKEPSVISKWLSGTHNFTQTTLFDICRKLKAPMSALYETKKPVVASRVSYVTNAYWTEHHSEFNQVLWQKMSEVLPNLIDHSNAYTNSFLKLYQGSLRGYIHKALTPSCDYDVDAIIGDHFKVEAKSNDVIKLSDLKMTLERGHVHE
jgi:transcriptional regulator with XRE-family HTH domain